MSLAARLRVSFGTTASDGIFKERLE